MDRRAAGVGLLVIALVVVSLPRVLAPTQLDGRASSAPLPEPPLVGECLLFSSKPAIPVPCDQVHHVEVTARWLADDPQRQGSQGYENCYTEADRYANLAGFRVDDWSISVDVRSAQIQAPPAERVGSRGWVACTISAGTTDGYEGSLHDITMTERPAATSTCSDDTVVGPVACHVPHDRETLATTAREVADPDGLATPDSSDWSTRSNPAIKLPSELASGLEAECVGLAATLLESPDPTRDGLLATRVVPQLFVHGTVDPALAFLAADCTIGPTGDRRLNATVVGLGAAAVPFG